MTPIFPNKRRLNAPVLAIALAFTATASLADITIGVSLPLTGPASGLGIPMANGVKLWKKTIAGEELKVLVLDDGGDPGKGAQNARRFVTEDKVDVILGSGATPVAIAMAEVAVDASTPQLAMSPAPLPAGRDTWTFRIPHSNGIMAEAIVNHMKKQGVKTVGLIGYTDAYGESWVNELKPRLDKAGLKFVATERFARTDTSVTAQALKLTSAQPDAIVVVASGSGAAMPHLALVDRGYKGKIYQTHAAATRDLIRVGGKGVEGALVSSAPMVVADQLPDNHPLKAEGMRFIQTYEQAYGVGSRNALGAHAWDALLLLEKAVPVALQKAKPGSAAFRSALRDALEAIPAVVLTGGVLDYTNSDHWGYRDDSGAIMKVVGGDWKLER